MAKGAAQLAIAHVASSFHDLLPVLLIWRCIVAMGKSSHKPCHSRQELRHILEYRTHHGSALWWWTLQAKRMPWRALKRGAQAMYNTSEAQSDCALG